MIAAPLLRHQYRFWAILACTLLLLAIPATRYGPAAAKVEALRQLQAAAPSICVAAQSQTQLVREKEKEVLWRPVGGIAGVEWEPQENMISGHSGHLTAGAPFRVHPYHRKARQTVRDQDVTIFTMGTTNRLPFLKILAERYQGPISLAYPVSASNLTAREAELRELDSIFASCTALLDWVDVHLVIDDRALRLNTWRNVARAYVRSSYVMMHDIDFWISPNLRQVLREPALLGRLESGDEAFVLPCFFVYDEGLAERPENFPATKEELVQLMEREVMGMPYPHSPNGHLATDYPHWQALLASSTEYYPTLQYTDRYEPYLVFNRHTAPYCDEAFGRFNDKMACIYDMKLSGLKTSVIPGGYLIHMGAKSVFPTSSGHVQTYHSWLFNDWKWGRCLEYMRYFVQMNALESEKAKEFRDQCLHLPMLKDSYDKMLMVSKDVVKTGRGVW